MKATRREFISKSVLAVSVSSGCVKPFTGQRHKIKLDAVTVENYTEEPKKVYIEIGNENQSLINEFYQIPGRVGRRTEIVINDPLDGQKQQQLTVTAKTESTDRAKVKISGKGKTECVNIDILIRDWKNNPIILIDDCINPNTNNLR